MVCSIECKWLKSFSVPNPGHLLGLQAASLLMHFLEANFALKARFRPQG